MFIINESVLFAVQISKINSAFVGISRLKIQDLDISCNTISQLPVELHAMDSLQFLRLDGNPLLIPPAQVKSIRIIHRS